MNSNTSPELPPEIGRCAQAVGAVQYAAPGGIEKPLLSGGGLRAGGKVLSGDAASAVLKFTDGTVVHLGPGSVFSIDTFTYESDSDADQACLNLQMGTFVLEAGDLAIGADDFQVIAGDSSFGVRSARIAVRVDPLGYDMVTLLPSRQGPLGEVLVHNKIGVQMLNRPYQTLRLGGAEADIPAPLTLPSAVVGETYGGPGMAAALFPPDRAEPEEDLAEQFQPFRTLSDRFLERQFISRSVFPGDGPAKTGEGDAFLEDTFEGTRFRLAADQEPEPSD